MTWSLIITGDGEMVYTNDDANEDGTVDRVPFEGSDPLEVGDIVEMEGEDGTKVLLERTDEGFAITDPDNEDIPVILDMKQAESLLLELEAEFYG